MLWDVRVPGGSHWSGLIRRGTTLRLVAQGDDANLAALFYSLDNPCERYNMADTLKAQHTAHLTTGCVAYSDMGRVLFGIVDDSLGWHDPLCGLSDAELLRRRHGESRFQEQRNERRVSGREAMLVELGKYGLGERDLVANINFFSKVVVDDAGRLAWQAGHCKQGDHVDLRFEMDCTVLLYAGPHPLDTRSGWAPADVQLQCHRSTAAASDDACRNRCPENARGYRNTEMYYLT